MTELSPAVEALVQSYYKDYIRQTTSRRLAAVLRALADHQHVTATDGPFDHWNPDDRTRRELRNLAEELNPRV